eukprot:CAMPEP_0198446588 /NCGR_PEP_ID=MMETSP1453-20131121/1483_1 /TAXON_ID=1461543 ORGANISM="Unidentified sp., Strain RCC701" /NCGR_SAMPLE_ID=MMETSP1453 /ASSEMBLY_ACC=CAM_ASM_001118 /LENGTH=257 /DNA_ID=CAMNT_0044167803 /DNA_START=38 /DNA_END=808 /DNA_ORIENTATION=-
MKKIKGKKLLVGFGFFNIASSGEKNEKRSKPAKSAAALILLLHALEGGEDVRSGDDADDLATAVDDREPVHLVLEHDGGGLSNRVVLLDGPGGRGHDLGDGAAALRKVLLGHDAHADALAVHNRDAGHVVEQLLNRLDGVGGSSGDDVGGHDAGDVVALLLLQDSAGVVLADVLVTGETPVGRPLSGGDGVLVDGAGQVWLLVEGEALDEGEPLPVRGRSLHGANLLRGSAHGGSAPGGEAGSHVHLRSVLKIQVRW